MGLPTLRQLEYFVTAARVGTLAGAAAEHHIAQPSLSEQISVLERTVKCALFSRTSRRLFLTDAGKQLLPLAERTLNDAREFSDWSRGIHDIERGTVSFGTFNSAHLYLLPHLIRDFLAIHPSVSIQVRGLNSAEVADTVRSGELEGGLVQLPIDDRELTVIATPYKDPVVYASVDPEHTAHPVDIRTLVERPLILSEARWANQDPLRVTLRRRAQEQGLAIEPTVEVEFQTHGLELAIQGIGDCLVSYHVGRSSFADGDLTWTLLDPPIEEQYAFVTRKNAPMSPATTKFMRLANKQLMHLARAQENDPGLAALRAITSGDKNTRR